MSCRWLSLATAVVMVVGSQALSAPASASTTVPARDATTLGPLSDARPASSIKPDRVRNPSVRSSAGRPIARPADLARTASPTAAARSYLKRYGARFQLSDPVRQTRLGLVTATAGGHAVRAQQLAGGLPVIGGELVVATDAANNLVSITGETATSLPRSLSPAVSAADAAERALARVARAEDVSESSLRASAPELSVYDASLLGPGSSVPRLVWRIEVSNRLDVRHYALVDAHRGAVVLDFSMIAEAKELHVCDRANVVGPAPDCTNPGDRSFVADADSGALPSSHPGAADVNAAFDNSSGFYDFVSSELERDSLDGAGMAMRSTVRYCDSGGCPFKNAYWNGSQMVYGEGYAVADDVVGHELTHGITEFTSGLAYYYQSGAINESMSDVFGELFDQRSREAWESPDEKWLIGENLGDGAIRDMKSPSDPEYQQPDSMTSPLYEADEAFTDNGGVHTNSGVGNKAAFLMTDGGDHGGVTVTGIGPDKTLQVWYRAAQLLTSGSDYADLAVALVQGCNALVGGPTGVTTVDCTQVANATQAVQMSVDPPNAPTTPAPVCPPDMSKTVLWQDGFEAATPLWTFANWLDENDPTMAGWGYDDQYATEKSMAMFADDTPARQWSSAIPLNSTGTALRALPVPSDGRLTYLRFDHAYDFEAGFDGAVLEYTTDGLTTPPRDAGALIDDASHGYNATISADYDNPIAGEQAFTGWSSGYTSTRVTLTSLGGKAVTPLFTRATDAGGGGVGWFIDNVEFYTCTLGRTSVAISQSTTTLTAGGSATISGRLVKTGTSTGVGSRSVRLEHRKRGTSAWAPLTSRTSSSTGAVSAAVKPTANTEYRWRFLGKDGWIASTSATGAVLVRPAISRSVNDSTIRLGTSFTVSGKVFPRMDGQTIKVQRYYRGGWHTVKGTTLARYDATRSRYAMTYRPPVRGTLRFRVYKPADAYHPSNYVTFTVTVR